VQYSDLGYILLGATLERAGGRSLPRLFAETVARPLGLTHTRYAGSSPPLDGAAATERGNAYERGLAGERGRNFAWRTHVLRGEVHDANAARLGGAAGHAGLFGTAEEVARLAREILEPRSLRLGEPARRRLLDPSAGGRTVGFVTAATSSAARGILPPVAPGHTGFTGTSLWLDPDRGRLFVLLTNRVHPEVGPRDFQLVRRAFHRTALRRSAS
jgi:CubicO group peptidase (beta-lactamase class C family)